MNAKRRHRRRRRAMTAHANQHARLRAQWSAIYDALQSPNPRRPYNLERELRETARAIERHLSYRQWQRNARAAE